MLDFIDIYTISILVNHIVAKMIERWMSSCNIILKNNTNVTKRYVFISFLASETWKTMYALFVVCGSSYECCHKLVVSCLSYPGHNCICYYAPPTCFKNEFKIETENRNTDKGM